jgi:hypothetical protein
VLIGAKSDHQADLFAKAPEADQAVLKAMLHDPVPLYNALIPSWQRGNAVTRFFRNLFQG